MLDLSKDARPDERFHLQLGAPIPKKFWIPGLVKVIWWKNVWTREKQPGKFVSVWLFGNAIHWYKGNTKCDGTRTRMYWRLQLDNGIAPMYDADPTLYVMTTTPKEMFSVRFFVKPSVPAWDVMGGA